jgi:hypothetical protein
MAVSIRKVEDVVIVDFSGPFTVEESIAEFREEVGRQFEQGMRQIVWNLPDVDSRDSVALGENLWARIADWNTLCIGRYRSFNAKGCSEVRL